jgi:hypothetical protein
MPWFCAAGVGGVTTVERFVSAAAKLRPTTRPRRRYITKRVNCNCTDKAGNIYFSAENLPIIFLVLREATGWAPRSSTCNAQGVPHRGFCTAGAGGATPVQNTSAPPRSYGQQLELAEGKSPQEFPCHCAAAVWQLRVAIVASDGRFKGRLFD